jgi:hypothetical protein
VSAISAEGEFKWGNKFIDGILKPGDYPNVTNTVLGPDESVYFGSNEMNDEKVYSILYRYSEGGLNGYYIEDKVNNFRDIAVNPVNGTVYFMVGGGEYCRQKGNDCVTDGPGDEYLYAVTLDASGNNLKWKWATGGTSDGWRQKNRPSISPDGNTVYTFSADDGADDGMLVALNASDGREKWRFTKPWYTATGSSVVGPDGTVYFGSYQNTLYAVTADGQLKWSFLNSRAAYVPFISTPVVRADGTVYVGADDGNLYAVTADGQLKWKYTTAGPVRSSPALSTDEKVVYVGTSAPPTKSEFYAICT